MRSRESDWTLTANDGDDAFEALVATALRPAPVSASLTARLEALLDERTPRRCGRRSALLRLAAPLAAAAALIAAWMSPGGVGWSVPAIEATAPRITWVDALDQALAEWQRELRDIRTVIGARDTDAVTFNVADSWDEPPESTPASRPVRLGGERESRPMTREYEESFPSRVVRIV